MADNFKILFLDAVKPLVELQEELLTGFRGALRTAGFVAGPIVEGFDLEFAKFCGV